MSVGKQFKQDWLDLGGGLRADLRPHLLRDNEAAVLKNLYPAGPSLVQRNGISRITRTSADQSNLVNLPVSVAQLKTVDDTLVTIAGCTTGGFAQVSGDFPYLEALNNADGGGVGSDSGQWQFVAYLNALYACRDGGGGLKRITDTYFQDAGIDAPAAAPVIADGGAGLIDVAGDYQIVYTYFNSRTSAESNPSDVSNTITLAALRYLDVTGLVASTNGQIDKIRIYLTLANQQGEYFLAKTIDNVSGSSTVSIAQDFLGRLADFDNYPPTITAICMARWQERLWLSDGEVVIRSGIGRFEGYDPDQIFQVAPDAANPIRAFISKPDMLMIGKTNEWYRISGTGSSLELKKLPGLPGVVARLSAVSGGPYDFWLTPSRDVIRYDGGEALNITTERIHSLFTEFSDNAIKQAVAIIHPSKPWYMLSVQETTTVTPGRLLIYNWVTNTWTMFQYEMGQNSFLPESPRGMYVGVPVDGSSDTPVILGVMQDSCVYQIEDENSELDDITPMSFSFRSKGYAPGGQLFLCINRHSGLNCTTVVGGNLDVSIYKDGETAPVNTRNVNVGVGRQWKRFSLSTAGAPGANLQLGVNSTLDQDTVLTGVRSGFTLSGISFKGVVLTRQPKAT